MSFCSLPFIDSILDFERGLKLYFVKLRLLFFNPYFVALETTSPDLLLRSCHIYCDILKHQVTDPLSVTAYPLQGHRGAGADSC